MTMNDNLEHLLITAHKHGLELARARTETDYHAKATAASWRLIREEAAEAFLAGYYREQRRLASN